MSNVTRLERRQAKPAKPAKPETIDLQIVLVFTVDGKAVESVPIALHDLPIPPDGQAGSLDIGLDARVLVAALEPHTGPAKRSGLIIPGRH